MSNKKLLVTGADGFIGSHLTEKLVREGYAVRAFVYYNSFNSLGWLEDCPKEIVKEIEIVAGDIRDPHGVEKAVEGCESVIHLAALISIPYSYNSPDTYISTNVIGTLNILQACRKLEINKLVQTSTSEVYGTAKKVPMSEDHPLQGQSPYSASKIAADQLAYSFYTSFGLPVTIARPFNTYGPRQSLRAVIPSIICQIAAGKNDIKIGATKPTRDFNYIDDTVGGFISALKSPNCIGETINFGSGLEISIEDTARLISELFNREINFIQEETRLRPKKSEVERLCADNSKALELLNWKPSNPGIEGLRAGLKKTIDWFTAPSNLAKYKPLEYNI